MRSKWRAYRRLPRAGRKLVGEAVLFLLLAKLIARHLRFAWVRCAIERPVRRRLPAGGQRVELQTSVRKAITYANEYLGVGAVCYPSALAAHAMLRRRGIGSTLHYGQTLGPTGKRIGHMWLDAYSDSIVGNEGGERDSLVSIASFSPTSD